MRTATEPQPVLMRVKHLPFSSKMYAVASFMSSNKDFVGSSVSMAAAPSASIETVCPTSRAIKLEVIFFISYHPTEHVNALQYYYLLYQYGILIYQIQLSFKFLNDLFFR